MSERNDDRDGLVERFANAGSFLDMGQVLHDDPSQGLTIRAGQIFEGKTVKGGKNLVVALRAGDGWMYYAHGDRCKKVAMGSFVSAVLSGDLEPKDIREVDVGRLSMAVIGLDALANRRTAEEQIEFIGEQRVERFLAGDIAPSPPKVQLM